MGVAKAGINICICVMQCSYIKKDDNLHCGFYICTTKINKNYLIPVTYHKCKYILIYAIVYFG